MKAQLAKSFLAVLALVICPAILHAQATRTWVSGVGDDANPCSRTAPGLTFAGAIVKTAPSGEVDVLDPGDFGPVTIAKSIGIYGNGAPGDIIVTSGNAITVTAGAGTTVVLRRLILNGADGAADIGVSITGGGTVIIDHCVITGFKTGIGFTAPGGSLVIKDSTVQNCTTAAVNLAPTAAAGVTIANSHITDSGGGVSAGPHATVNVTDSISSGHASAGFTTTAAGAVMTLTRCVSFDNVMGVLSSGTMTLNDCAVLNNSTNGLKYTTGAKLNTFGNNSVSGNTPDGAASTFPLVKK